MGRLKKRVENQNGHSVKGLERLLRELLCIRDVAKTPDTVTIHHDRPVRNFNRQYVDIANGYFFARPQGMSAAFGLARAGERPDRFVEYVRKPLRQSRHRIWRAVHVDRAVARDRQAADVIDPVNVVGVIMREENRVHVIHSRRDELEPQLRGGIDEDAGPPIRLDQRADAGPLVTRISRAAYRAAASDLRYAGARSRPQERQLQIVSTLSRLVVPGVSNGTPAVTMMRSPLEASSCATTASFARVIISS